MEGTIEISVNVPSRSGACLRLSCQRIGRLHILIEFEPFSENVKMANPNKTELSTNSDRLMRMISRKNDIESLLISVGQDYRKEEIEKEEYDYLNHHFEHELNALNKQIIEAKISVQIPHSEEDQLSDVVCEFIQHKNVLQITRYLLHSLVEKVIVYKDRQIKVTFKFQDEIEEIKTKIENIRKKV